MSVDKEILKNDFDRASTGRARLLMVSFSCDPDVTMEDRNGWHRAIQAAEDFDVTVLTCSTENLDRLYQHVPPHLVGRIQFLSVPLTSREQKQLQSDWLFYRGYRAWLRRGKELSEKLHAVNPFALTQLVSLCSYREPGYLWQLDCPFILGPIGGTSGFPVRFLSIVDVRSGVFELTRNVINYFQLKFSKRVRLAICSSARVFAANQSTQQDLLKMSPGHAIPVELETGLDYEISPSKPIRNSNVPLKLLWTGRLRAWKGLPILLRAIALLPQDIPVQLRVIGDGSSRKSLERLAKRLRISDRIEWLSRPPYRESIAHYRWADAFCFTSLRDTSGTGLLEALAAGTPIIGMNHQGAADIMNDQCALKISVVSPKRSIKEFAQAIAHLAGDSAHLKQLSDGALSRAEDYTWERRHETMRQTYLDLLKTHLYTGSSEPCGWREASHTPTIKHPTNVVFDSPKVLARLSNSLSK